MALSLVQRRLTSRQAQEKGRVLSRDLSYSTAAGNAVIGLGTLWPGTSMPLLAGSTAVSTFPDWSKESDSSAAGGVRMDVLGDLSRCLYEQDAAPEAASPDPRSFKPSLQARRSESKIVPSQA